MPYEPIRAKFVDFADLRVGEKFTFYCDMRSIGAEQNMKVSDDCFLSLGMDGNGCGGLGTITGEQRKSAVERLGMMAEDRYVELTAAYR